MYRKLQFFYIPLFIFALGTIQSLHAQVSIISEGDTLSFCAGDSILISAEGAESYNWTPEDWFTSNDSSSVWLKPQGSGFIFVTGFNEGEESVDSIFIELTEISISISWSGQTEPICEGLPIQLSAETSHNLLGEITWEAFGNPNIPNDNNVTINAPRGGQVIGFYSLNNCTVSDTLQINVIDFGVPTLVSSDTTVCQGSSFALASDPGPSSTLYTWTPENFLNDPSIPNPTHSAQGDAAYTLFVSSEDGRCTETLSINVSIIPITLNINVADSTFICLGDTAFVRANVNGSTDGFSWFPDDGAISSTTDLDVEIIPDFTNFYIARYELNGCVLIDTIWIIVDSLPKGTNILVVPEEDKYCPGDEISLFSRMYNGLNFPDISFEWSPPTGITSSTNNYNATISAVPGEFWYQRTITNGGCEIIDSIFIFVVDPVIELNITDTIICPGERVQIRILNEVEDISWSPDRDISCTDCPNPIVNPSNSTVYTVTGEVDGCPASNRVNVQTFPLPNIVIDVLPEGDIFIGDPIKLVANSFPPLPEDAVYTWEYNGRNMSERGDTLFVNADLAVNNVVLRFTTDDGCQVEISRNVTAMEPEYDIPNAFTPDNDMINDVFRAVLRGAVEVVEMRVFNRWGQLVYQANNNDGWDGNFRGNMAPPDVYAYFFIFRLPNGRTFQERGDVTLLR